MALKAVVLQQDSFIYGCKDFFALGGGGSCSYGFGFEEDRGYFESTLGSNIVPCFSAKRECSSPSSMVQTGKEGNANTSSPENCTTTDGFFTGNCSSAKAPAATACWRKRRRTRSIRNKEEVENQRMTHIAVERNRRKQMNDYLAVLRSMMPASYVQRGDQASIIGGAINFVKELEQLLQSLEAKKRIKQRSAETSFSSLFSDFFSFPQYSTCSTQSSTTDQSMAAEKRPAIADVEVTLVESHANIKVLSRKHPKQLLKMVTGLHSLCLVILHLNVTTVDNMVMYSFSVKVEDDSRLTSVNEIAAAVYEMVGRIQEEAGFS